MRRCLKTPSAIVVCLACFLTASHDALSACRTVSVSGGSLGRYCVPDTSWNGDLIVFVHGYIAPEQPLDFYHTSFGGLDLSDIVTGFGFAFAATTLRENGLAVLSGIEDVKELIRSFPRVTGKLPRRIFIIGASQGALISLKAMEDLPRVFSGGLILCGPIGSFQRQFQYIGDFRMLFDYFFPGFLPGSVTHVPPELVRDWYAVYKPALAELVQKYPGRVRELCDVAGAAYDPARLLPSLSETLDNLLWYHTFGFEDSVNKLEGLPSGNSYRRYRGSSDDGALNREVMRIKAEPVARRALSHYETSGRVTAPVVVAHTLKDDIVPFWHAVYYWAKTERSGSDVTFLPINRYGHCNFTLPEIISAFFLLVSLSR